MKMNMTKIALIFLSEGRLGLADYLFFYLTKGQNFLKRDSEFYTELTCTYFGDTAT